MERHCPRRINEGRTRRGLGWSNSRVGPSTGTKDCQCHDSDTHGSRRRDCRAAMPTPSLARRSVASPLRVPTPRRPVSNHWSFFGSCCTEHIDQEPGRFRLCLIHFGRHCGTRGGNCGGALGRSARSRPKSWGPSARSSSAAQPRGADPRPAAAPARRRASRSHGCARQLPRRPRGALRGQSRACVPREAITLIRRAKTIRRGTIAWVVATPDPSAA
jgi:hypothetical protein